MCNLLFSLFVMLTNPPDVKVIQQNKNSYVCFPPADAQKLLQLRLDFPNLQLKLEKLESLVLLADTQRQKLQLQLDDVSLALSEQYEVNTQLEQELEQKPEWYKNTTFYALVGFVSGVFLGVVVDQVAK